MDVCSYDLETYQQSWHPLLKSVKCVTSIAWRNIMPQPHLSEQHPLHNKRKHDNKQYQGTDSNQLVASQLCFIVT